MIKQNKAPLIKREFAQKLFEQTPNKKKKKKELVRERERDVRSGGEARDGGGSKSRPKVGTGPQYYHP